MKRLRIHYLQHVPFEGPGSIEKWVRDKGYQLTATRLYEGGTFPKLDEVGCVVVMGGPMSVHDEMEYPWLKREKIFIKEAIEAGKVVLGICLGAQLIAEVLGAKVYANRHREIGWFPIQLSEEAQKHPLFSSFPAELNVFHWHCDTFDLPPGAVHLASSQACHNQAFLYQDKVLGLQFHLEMSETGLLRMLHHCEEDLQKDSYVQTANEMFRKNNFKDCHFMLKVLLNMIACNTLTS